LKKFGEPRNPRSVNSVIVDVTNTHVETPMEIMSDGPVLLLGGDLDVRSTWDVRNAIYELLGSYDGDVVIDLTDVDSADVTALRVLAVATRQALRDGHHLTLRGCSPAVRRMLLISHLNRLVELDRRAVVTAQDVG
jgi:anti-anti-sigma factor